MEITKMNKTIDYGDVDYSGHLKLSSLFQMLSDIAITDAIKTGIWNEDMADQYGWVVTKQTVELDSPISLDDTIELSTEAGIPSYVTFPRYYFIKRNKKEIGKVSSIWTFIDTIRRSIVAPKRIGMKIPDFHPSVILDRPKAINDDIEMEQIRARKVLYSDVDTNQHMHNTRYIEWALDLLDYDLFKDHYIDEITVHYKKEIKPLETVKLYLGQDKEDIIVKGMVGEDESFLVEIHPALLP